LKNSTKEGNNQMNTRPLRMAGLVLYLGMCGGAAGAATYGDVTFYVVSDLHYGIDVSTGAETATGMVGANQATIDSMNKLPGTHYPASIGGVVDTPRGVLVLGDLTNWGDSLDWSLFTRDWGVNGEKRIAYPVYEGYGNHDLYPGRNSPVAVGIRARNLQRKGIAISPFGKGAHYSWDWDNVHFVQFNLFAGDSSGGDAYPDSSLAFLKSDLAQRVGNSGRPVVLMQHYGWDNSAKTYNWTDAARTALYDAIKSYNVIGFFNGHCHCIDTTIWNGTVNIYDDGSVKQWNGGTGNFYVVHITKNTMTVANRESTGWHDQWIKTINSGIPTSVASRAGLSFKAFDPAQAVIALDLRGRRICAGPMMGTGHAAGTGTAGGTKHAGVFFVKAGDRGAVTTRFVAR
jgi:hypothetical protein